MSRIVVNLEDSAKGETEIPQTSAAPAFGDYQQPKKRGGFVKFLRVLGIALVLILAVGAIGGFFYWQNLKKTPQYSLALLIDAARRGDQKAVDEFVDADAIVDDFMPQITEKAIEIYGRNLPPATIAKIQQVAAPLLPAVKLRARDEIPGLIRDKTQKLARVPFWAIALAANRYVDITREGDTAFISGRARQQELSVNLILKRNGDKWQVVGIKDEDLAQDIAEKIGQQMIAAAGQGGIQKAGEQFGVQNLNEIIKQIDGIFK